MRYIHVYKLEHIRLLQHDKKGNCINDRKLLGFFSDKSEIDSIMPSLLQLPGFSQYPNEFFVKKIRIHRRNAHDIMCSGMPIYKVEHEYYDDVDDCDVVTYCGLFDDLDNAEYYIDKIRVNRRFRKYPEGFSIGESQLNMLSPLWSEGFD